VNPQLAPQLNDKLQQKIASQTKLTRTNNDNADLQLGGYISGYDVSTTAITTQQATANRLTVTVHMIVKNLPDNKTDEFDVSRNFD
ncbi:LPS assembly lipoprotein LptE, partial [Acinetobacter baumannii]